MSIPESVSTISRPSSIVDQEVIGAARSGDIEMLYRLIREDRNVLERISMKKFEDTPLHLAAAEGKTDFAMEMMYLQPSFATKLNADGLSPLHLALQNKHTGLALSLLKIDESLVSVKGKLGYTPFHYLVMNETASDDLTKFLKNYPDCIHDVTSQDETPLHVAARSITNSNTLEVMLHWLRRTSNFSMEQKQSILNLKSRNGDTVLHIAVSNEEPDPEIVRILRDLRIYIKAKNSEGKTALNILEGRTRESKINVSECEDILRHAQGLPAIARKTAWYFLQMLSQWGYEIKHMSNDRGNALLVVTVLILTATYQATLSPPGGVFQANAAANDSKISGLQIYFGSKNTSHLVEKIEFKANKTAGSSVLDTQPFLWFFIPNVVAFSTSFIITCLVLVTLVRGYFSFVLVLSLSMLLLCLLDSAVIIISPNNESSKALLNILFCNYIVVYFTCLFIVPVVIPKIRSYRNASQRFILAFSWMRQIGRNISISS